MAAEAPLNKYVYTFTNRKLTSLHSESVPRSMSKASTYSYAEKMAFTNFPPFHPPPPTHTHTYTQNKSV